MTMARSDGFKRNVKLPVKLPNAGKTMPFACCQKHGKVTPSRAVCNRIAGWRCPANS